MLDILVAVILLINVMAIFITAVTFLFSCRSLVHVFKNNNVVSHWYIYK